MAAESNNSYKRRAGGCSLRRCAAGLAASTVLTLVAVICTVQTAATVRRLLPRLPNAPLAQPQFNATPSFIRLWASAWSDYSALRQAPLGPVLADLVHALDRHQNPAHCANASFLVFEYHSPLGFGAQIRHMLVAFYLALQTDRVFVLSEQRDFYWANGCADASHNHRFTCHFRPLSHTCAFSTVNKLIKRGRMRAVHANYSATDWLALDAAARSTPSALHLSHEKLGARFGDFLHSFAERGDFVEQVSRLLPSTPPHRLQPQAHARRLWLSAAAFYTTRLNSRSARHVRTAVEQVLTDNGGIGPSRLLGAPVRASDKCYGSARHDGPGEMTCVSLEDVGDVVRRLALMQPELTHVVITSEDAAAISEQKVGDALGRVARAGAPLRVVRFDADVRPGTGNTNRAPRRLRRRRAYLLDSMLVVLQLQALAEVHVLTPRSTFHSLIAVLADTTPCKRRHLTYPLGTWRDINASIASQLMR